MDMCVLDTKQSVGIEREQVTKIAALALYLSPWNLDSDCVMSLSQLLGHSCYLECWFDEGVQCWPNA